ncbi:MAG: hypothetical protein IK093_10215, partial [Ruminiclostridium sp.]|nr:hypothetical protein [Ruminiclostridium sp.]
MTSYLKKLTAVLLAAVLIICGAPAVSAEDLLFRGSISADSGLNAGGISIEVYGSRERYSKNGLKRYEHYYIKTVTTDSTGNFSFTRPAGKTLLRVDLSTLPRGTGVSAMTRLVDKKCDDPFRLSRIDNITISASGDGNVYKVNLNAKDGSPLFAEYDTTESVSASFRDVTYDTLNYVELYRTVNVNAGGVRGSDTFKLDISSCTVNGKLNRLMDYGIIDEYTRQEIIDAYNIDTATPDDLRPEFFDERTFTAGGFMLHSERSTQDVELYESILADIVNVYFTKYGFLEPYHEFVNGSSTLREKYFHIYLVDPDAIRIDSEVAPKNVVGKTMKADPTNVTKGCYIVLSPNEPEDFRTTLSHEIFHSIIYRYLGKDCATWFKEAFSNYGAMLCLNGAVTSMKKQMSHYLNSPGYTLSDSSSYRNRQYGLTLIPLYIHNKLGGVKTIKNILKAYANSNNAFKAIDKGLKKTNRSYSFS